MFAHKNFTVLDLSKMGPIQNDLKSPDIASIATS